MEKATFRKFKSTHRIDRDARARARFEKSWAAAAWRAHYDPDDDTPWQASHPRPSEGVEWWREEVPNAWAYEDSGDWPLEEEEEDWPDGELEAGEPV